MKIAPDKWKHFFVGIPMGAVLMGFCAYILPAAPMKAALLAMAPVVGISYGFELFSKVTGKGHYDVMDAFASILGGFIGIGAVLPFLL